MALKKSDSLASQPASNEGSAKGVLGSPMSRRSLLKTISGGVVLAGFGGGFLEACSTPSAKSSVPVKSSKALTVLISTDPPALDPIKYNAGPMERQYRQVVESLYEWTEEKTIVPLLAAAMPSISPDGLTYTVPLRKGVVFHNGKSFGADDVKYTYEQCMLESNGSIWLPNFAKVSSIVATDPHTVTITLSEVFTPFLSAMAMVPIIPSNVAYTPTVYARSLIGTGPFAFDSWEEGVAIHYSKFDKYWSPGLPKAKTLTFSIVPSTSSRIASLVDGTGQLIDKVAAKDVSVLTGRGAKVDILENSSVVDYMYPNVEPGRWTSNVNARLAVAWAMDRKEILDQVFSGIGVAESTLPQAGAQYYDTSYGSYFGQSPDVAKAKGYVTAAGGPPSKALEIVVLSNDVTDATAPIVEQNLSAIGVPSQIITLGETPALSRLFSLDYDLFLLDVTVQQSSGFGSYLAYLAVYPGAFANFNKFNDPTMTTLVSAAVSATTSSAQAAAWKAVQQEWVKQVPQVLLVTSHFIEAANKSLKGYSPTGLCQLMNLKYAYVS